MKKLVFLLCCVYAFACSGKKDSVPEGFYKLHDTLFIKREICDTCVTYPFYNAIYLETDPQGDTHKRLQNFSFNEFENLDSYNKELKEMRIHVSHFNTFGLPKEWLPLNLYKGKYYLYAPCDGFHSVRKMLTDSSLIFRFMEGPMPYSLVSLKKISTNEFRIETTNPYYHSDDEVNPELLNIYMIDLKNKVAIWEFKSKKNTINDYELMVAKESVPKFDVIHNFCLSSKQDELTFDTPNFDSLLHKFRDH